MQAFLRACRLSQSDEQRYSFGLGMTAALRSLRPKRGEHRAFIALQTSTQTLVWHLPFEKNVRSRVEEERELANAAYVFLTTGLGLHPESPMLTAEEAGTVSEGLAPLFGEAPSFYGEPGSAVLPGAFNPLHKGHTGMRTLAEKILGNPVKYELSIQNADKPMLDCIDISNRMQQFNTGECVFTNQSTFVDKARLLFNEEGGTFVVGVDTLTRIDHPSYYGSTSQRNAAIKEMARLGVRFLVFGRQEGKYFATLSKLAIGSDLRDLCEEVPETAFRCDISSTQIRAGRTSQK